MSEVSEVNPNPSPELLLSINIIINISPYMTFFPYVTTDGTHWPISILTGLVLSSNGICLNTQLAVKVNIFSFANFVYLNAE